MNRQHCFLLALAVTFFVSPDLYAQHGGVGGHSGGHFGGGSFSGHSVGHSVGHSFCSIFGHYSSRQETQAGKVRSGGGNLPPLAGAAFIHGRTRVLTGPTRGIVWQPRHPLTAPFRAVSAPRMSTRFNHGFNTCFCGSFCFTWRSFLFPGDFDCFGDPLLSDRFFSRSFRGGYFWSDSFSAIGGPGDFTVPPETSESFGLTPKNDDSAALPEAEPPTPLSGRAEQPVTLLQLRDGSMYGLTRYWVEGNSLHYVTDYGGSNSVALDHIDVVKTKQLNAAQGTPFILPAARQAP